MDIRTVVVKHSHGFFFCPDNKEAIVKLIKLLSNDSNRRENHF